MVLLIVLIGILTIFSAFFSSCEIAYSSVNKIKLKKEAEEGNKKASAAIKIIDNYSTAISTILVGNNLVNIFIQSLGTLVFIHYFGEELGQIYSIVILTLIVLIFGEIFPKALANKYSYSLSLAYTTIYNFFRIIFYPVTFLVNKVIGKTVNKLAPKETIPTATDEELITLTEELEEEGLIDSDDAELIISAIDFCDITAHEIMIPRVDMFSIDIDDDQKEILSNEEIFRFSRVPVYENTIDNIIGILDTTTLMKKLLAGQQIDLRNMLDEPMYVHKTKHISNILTEFKENNKHISIVVDEFGGVMGIVTMEDIVEELVGDIFDEMDEVVLDYKEVSENVYDVDGDMNIYDFFELVEYDNREFESEYTTVGGWCTEVLEKFPQVGDNFEFANFTVTITDAEAMRVGIVRVEIKEVEEEE